MNPPGEIERAFMSYLKACHGGERISVTQLIETRRAFFGGAAAFYGLLMGNVSPGNEPTEADLDMMNRLHDELIGFAIKVGDGET